MTDDKVERIERAFNAARQRYCEAVTLEGQEDEASNMLHHFYRLVEQRGGVGALGVPGGTGHAAAMCFLRNVDTHEATTPAASADVFSDYFTEMWSTLVWRVPGAARQDRRYAQTDAQWLEGRPVVDSISAAFATVRGTTS